MKTNILILLVLSTLFSCGTKEEGKPVVQDIKELVFASGELEWDNSYNLTAQTDGILVNATFDVGNKVTENQIIASIDNKTNENNTASAKDLVVISKENLTDNAPALQQLQQNIKFAESKYQQDKTQAERYKRLYNSQSIAKVEYENMQLAAENSLSQLNALKKQYQQILQQYKQNYINTENQLKNNQVVLGYNKLIIPQKGTIIKKMKFSGDYVKKGDVIAVIADENKVEGVLNVDENSIGKVKIGQTVFVQLNTNKNEVYNAKVSEILAAFDEQTQSFICKVIFDKPLNASLYGAQLEANILVGEKKNALLIPRNFLGFGNKVMIKGKDEAVIVKTGIVSTEFVEILEGITKEDVLLPLKP